MGPVAKTLAPDARGLGSIPGQGTRSRMPQLTVHMLQLKIRLQQKLKIPHATPRTQQGQINIKKKNYTST